MRQHLGLGTCMAQLAVVLLVFSSLAAAASFSEQKQRLAPSGVEGLRQLPVTDKGTALHGCIMKLAAGVEQDGDARILDLREEYELESLTNAIGPQFSEQLAAQMPAARVGEFCQAVQALYPSGATDRIRVPDSGTPDPAPSDTKGSTGQAFDDHTSAPPGPTAHTSRSNRTLPAAAGRKKAHGAVGQRQPHVMVNTPVLPICDDKINKTRGCNVDCSTNLCTVVNASYQGLDGSFGDLVRPISGLYKTNPFKPLPDQDSPGLAQRVNAQSLAGAEGTCQLFDYLQFVANVICEKISGNGIWAGVAAGTWLAPIKIPCLAAQVLFQYSFQTCLLFTQFSEVADLAVDQAELRAAYNNSRSIVQNQQVLYEQVTELNSDIKKFEDDLNEELCDIVNLIAALQRELNILRSLALKPPTRTRAEYDGSKSSCPLNQPVQCNVGFNDVAVTPIRSVAACDGT